MALSPSVLSELIQSEISGEFTISDAPTLKKFADAVAAAVVQHLTGAGVVLPTAMKDGMGSQVTGTGTIQ